jgi:hypothetical protein
MRLTLGDYMFRQPGIIKNMTYTISNDSPWEIAIDEPETGGNLYELPHVMTIQMTFAPIHDFVPRKFPLNKPTTQENNETVSDWRNLPAFMADRQTNKNEWLTSIFGKNNKIPNGKSTNISSQTKNLRPTIDDIQQQNDFLNSQLYKTTREKEERRIPAFNVDDAE